MNYKDFAKDVAIGDIVLIDDGKIVLNVLETNQTDEVIALVESGGKLSGRKGVNLTEDKNFIAKPYSKRSA
jgi:pyruvate kinase